MDQSEMRALLIRRKYSKFIESIIFAGESKNPHSFSLCSVLVSTLVVCAVITAMYSANLIAFLSVEKYQVPFETFLELSEQNSYRFGFVGGSSLVNSLKVHSYLYPTCMMLNTENIINLYEYCSILNMTQTQK